MDGVALPIMKKIQESGVLGEHDAQYTSRVQLNMDEWEKNGSKEIEEMFERIQESITPPSRLSHRDHSSVSNGSHTTISG